MDKQTMQQELMESFDFTERDLEFNRSGMLSPEQKDSLEQRARYSLYALLGSPIVLVIFMYVINPKSIVAFFSPWFSLSVFGFIFFVFGRGYWRHKRASQGDVENVTGVPEIRYHPMNVFKRPGYYELIVDKRKLRYPDSIYVEFAKGQRYTIYYSRHLDRPASIEPL